MEERPPLRPGPTTARFPTPARPPVVPAIDASTVMVLRDAPGTVDGLEVLLLRRHGRSRAFPGAYVYPGGKVDESDRELSQLSWRCEDLAGWQLHLGVDSDEAALGLLVAAVRETFEEAGLLLARHRDGTPVSGGALVSRSFVAARERLASRSARWDWSQWLADNGLMLDLDALQMWAWWVTPVHRPHRFDTRFFVAAAPPDQDATHDGVEATALRWAAPGDILREYAQGRINLRKATVNSLDILARFTNVERALAGARDGKTERRRNQPRVVLVDGEFRTESAIGEPPQTDLPLADA